MGLQILILLAGLLLVVLGADWLVDGSSAIARKAGLSEFVIGLTIIGIGTSMPELVVSLTGALKGSSDIAVGNVVGSNIFNVLLILGLTAVIRPVGITRANRRQDIPLNLIVGFLLIICGYHFTLFRIGREDILSRFDGILFLVLFAVYMYMSFKNGKEEAAASEGEGTKEKTRPLGIAILMVIAGLAALVFGGDKFVDSARTIAGMLGISDKFIAVTILAGGTSMPELVTCVVAAFKKKDQLALGNIIGSNISNILLILGSSSVVYRRLPGGPGGLSFGGMTVADLGILILSSLLLWSSSYTGRKDTIDRADGSVFLTCFAVYMVILFHQL
ncbi:MAG: calcium/sodium antiporter [Bacteroidales bacterium]|nr:calcium/sodium antiporter [Bacteroidales bacterium]